MYMEYFGLTADPFRLTADQDNLYSHRSLNRARSYLQFGLQANEGIVLVTGESGTGKTTLVDGLVESSESRNLYPTVIECADYTGRELLRHYASILTGNSELGELPDVLHAITDSLKKIRSEGTKAVLVLDEAHQLSDDALVKLRSLTNLKHDGEQLLQIFLIGLPALREKILQSRNEQLHQRIVATCEVEPLTEEETKEYIIHNLVAAGWNGAPAIDAAVFKLIHNSTLGVRRWINLTGSRLLLYGMANQKKSLELADVCEVLCELLNEDLLSAQVRHTNKINGKLQVA